MASTCKTVKITSSDSDVIYELDITVATKSSYIEKTVSDLCQNGETELSLTFPHSHKSIEKLIEYMTYYTQYPMPQPYKYVDGKTDWETQLCEWDKQFINFDNRFEFFEFFNLVNVVGMPSLMSLAAMTCAKQINGMTVEEMRSYFNVENDFTPEEEEELRKEFSWARDDDAEPMAVEPMAVENNTD